jgi:ribosomal protein S18 acetylase RimI-like enzyme
MYTAALREFEAHAFLGAGFEVHESLHVLEHTLRSLPTVDSPVKLRRARRHDLSSVLSVDHQAFEPFWQLDEAGIREAIAATPSARYRVADNGAVVGYAICGRADSVGFIQRLAVHPQVLRSGIGSALIVDALRWLKRRGVRQALVNTQPGNSPALSLYQRLGFTLREEPLLVLTWHR